MQCGWILSFAVNNANFNGERAVGAVDPIYESGILNIWTLYMELKEAMLSFSEYSRDTSRLVFEFDSSDL